MTWNNNPLRVLCYFKKNCYNPFPDVACMAFCVKFTVPIVNILSLKFLKDMV